MRPAGRTNKNALHYAVEETGRPEGIDSGKREVAALLIDKGIDISLKSTQGETPFDVVKRQDRLKIFDGLKIKPSIGVDRSPEISVQYAVMGEVVAKSGAILRDRPSRKGRAIETIPNSKMVFVVATDGPQETIDNTTANWYKVQAMSKQEGWVFGALIGPLEKKEVTQKREGPNNIKPSEIQLSDKAGKPIKPEIQSFITRFFNDEEFQINHIRFPLTTKWGGPDEEGENKISKSELNQPYSLKYAEKINLTIENRNDGFELIVTGVECGISVTYVFKSMNGDNFLIEVNDYSC